MNDDATHEGVSDEESENNRTPNPRDDLLGVIATRHREERDDEFKKEGYEVADTLNLEAEITGQEEDEDSVSQAATSNSESEKTETSDIEDQDEEVHTGSTESNENNAGGDHDHESEDLVTVKVDGKEYAVSQEEIDAAGGVKAYQLEKAAENRLNEAKEILRDAKEATSTEAQNQGDQRSDTANQPGNTETVTSEDLGKVVESLRYGTEEEGVEALQGLLTQAGGKPTNSTDVMELATAVNAQINYNTAMENLNQDYPHIMGDPLLVKLASEMDDQMIANGDQRPYTERYAEIGEKITEKYYKGGKSSTGKKDLESDTSLDTRRQRKQKLDKTPDPAGGKRQTGSSQGSDEPPQRRPASEVINAMAAARGQRR